MKVIVTGAGGFLGRHIALKLIEQGHQVYNFSRNNYSDLESKGVISILGDISCFETVNSAFSGKDAVIHTAAKVGMWGKWEDFYNTNCIGTENVVKACEHNKIDKLVYTSTPSVVFGKIDICNADESTPYPNKFLTSYAHTKSIAESLVLNANNSTSLRTVALRPHLIFGPGDLNLIPRVIEKAKQNQLKIVGRGNNLVDVIYVENAADAHILALQKLSESTSICGKAFFIGQEKPVNLWDFINKILEQNSISKVTKKVPTSVAYFAGALFESIWKTFKITKWEPPMTRFIALQLSKSHYFNLDNAKNILGYTPRIKLEESLSRIIMK